MMGDGVGRKRQLPQWMFVKSQENEKVKTDQVDCSNTEEEIVTQKPSKSNNIKKKDKNETFTEESSMKLVRCQATKRSKRNLSLPNDDCNDESRFMARKCDNMTKLSDDVPLLKSRRPKQKTNNLMIDGGAEIEGSITEAGDRIASRKRNCRRMEKDSNEAGPSLRRQKLNTKSSKNDNWARVEELAAKSDDEDLTVDDLMSIAEEYAGDAGGDLTVEDLMSFAKEYVKENEEPSSGKEKVDPMEDPISMSNSSLRCTETDSLPLRREEISSDSLSVDKTAVEDLPKLNMSSDPTQDMLDVFLGPLLKKTQGEKSIDLVCEEMTLAHDLNRQKQRYPSDGLPVLVKKKSSLKDKVALLLD